VPGCGDNDNMPLVSEHRRQNGVIPHRARSRVSSALLVRTYAIAFQLNPVLNPAAQAIAEGLRSRVKQSSSYRPSGFNVTKWVIHAVLISV
jgi:hypothetical protein